MVLNVEQVVCDMCRCKIPTPHNNLQTSIQFNKRHVCIACAGLMFSYSYKELDSKELDNLFQQTSIIRAQNVNIHFC